jgi:hypothetical protein
MGQDTADLSQERPQAKGEPGTGWALLGPIKRGQSGGCCLFLLGHILRGASMKAETMA